MAGKASRQVIREAGPLERYHFDRAEVGFDTCVIVSAKYTASGHVLDKTVLYPALSTVILQLAPLSVQVDIPGNPRENPTFVRLSTVLLDEVVSFVEVEGPEYEGPLRQLMETQLSERFELGTAAPLWRLVVVSGHTVIFAYYHGIGDGQSGMAFHHALLSALNSPLDAASPSFAEGKVDVPDSTSRLLRPAVEKLTNLSPSFSIFCKTIFETFAPTALTKGSSAWTGNPVVRVPSVQTNVRLWEILASDAAHLLKLCRKNKTTITGFFHTLLVGVISKHVVGLKGKKKYNTLSMFTALSLRRFTGTSPTGMCLEVSVFHFYPRIAPFPSSKVSYDDIPWATSSKITEKFRTGAEKAKRKTGMAKFIYILGISKTYYTDNLGKKREGTVALSNLGQFPAPQQNGDGRWSIGSMFFTQCDSVTGAAIKVSIIGSPSGSVNVAFSWGPGSHDESLAETIIADVKAGMSSILATTPSE